MDMPKSGGIYLISDSKNLAIDDLLDKTEKILDVGISLFQFRDKNSKYEIKKSTALKLQTLCKKYNTLFIINDDVVLAKEISADGVHLGRDDMDIDMARKILGDKIIGFSCYNNLEDAITAEIMGADYIALGSFFNSPTKPEARKIAIDLLPIAKSKLNIPVVAIGGITPENGKQLVDNKVDFLAIISGIYASTDIINSVKAYKNLFY
ncbi:MAG: thiamine phosphate synthase [Legionellales bacterium]|nr:thiamine phosphate synthase [Legionellales bacterium]|tara:strand:+ start:2282 stop:2905 length:624 start_codon:yes stop_codon:yes gene_type:complete